MDTLRNENMHTIVIQQTEMHDKINIRFLACNFLKSMFSWDTTIKDYIYNRKGFAIIFKNLLKTDNPVVLNDVILVL